MKSKPVPVPSFSPCFWSWDESFLEPCFSTGLWFQHVSKDFFIFIPISGNDPIWLIFSDGLKPPTSQCILSRKKTTTSFCWWVWMSPMIINRVLEWVAGRFLFDLLGDILNYPEVDNFNLEIRIVLGPGVIDNSSFHIQSQLKGQKLPPKSTKNETTNLVSWFNYSDFKISIPCYASTMFNSSQHVLN